MINRSEFSRKINLSQIKNRNFSIEIEANEKECADLAKRFHLPQIMELKCHYDLTLMHRNEIHAIGKLKALVMQNCVVSLEDFPSAIQESFELKFVPADKIKSSIEEIDEPDEIPYEGDSIDLGEVTSEQLFLSLDAYPHKEGASHPLILNEDDLPKTQSKETNPFAVLKSLKSKKT